MGKAIAEILFGQVSPSGKLSETFPVKLSDNPSHMRIRGENGKLYYREGLFIGYRYYDRKELAPQFPFGHGLSYTSFAYKDMKALKRRQGSRSLSGWRTSETEQERGRSALRA